MGSGRVVPYREYVGEEAVLITCASYEERSVDSTERVLSRNQKLRSCVLVKLSGETVSSNLWRSLTPDPAEHARAEVQEAWDRNYKGMVGILRAHQPSIEITEVPLEAEDPYGLARAVWSDIPRASKVILDISCFPKHILLSLLRWRPSVELSLFYTRPKSESNIEDEISVGVQRIGILRGFEGEVKLGRPTLLVLLLGFEGSRAMAIFRHFEPQTTLALCGNPDPVLGPADTKFYIDSARQNNAQLMSNQRVVTKALPSLDPESCAESLEDAIGTESAGKSMNILLSVLGTKAQVVGTYLYLIRHQETQVAYTIPIRRGVASRGTGSSWVYLHPHFGPP